MDTNRKTAIIVGILFLTAFVAGILSLVFLGSILDGPDYLINVSVNKNQVIIGALFQLIMAVAGAGIAIWLYPVLKKYNPSLALGSVGFRIIEAVLFIVSAVGLLSLLILSQEFIKAGAPVASHFQTLGTLTLAVRDSFSFGPGAIAFCLGALMYYYIFYQSKLIPRWLSCWGFIAAAMHLSGALLIVFGDKPFSTISIFFALPIALNELVLSVWLIVKGFNPSAISSGSAKGDN